MPQPTPYVRQYSFASFQGQNPTAPLPAQKLDLELTKVKATLDQVLTNLALIQRDDGALANGSVGRAQLDGVLISLGFDRPSLWATTTAYKVNSAVFQSNGLYICAVAHTSGVFATDLAASKWVLTADFSSLASTASASAAAAAASAAAAAGSQTSATASMSSASASAISATASAASATAAYNSILALTQGRSLYAATNVVGTANAIQVVHSPARAARVAGVTGVFAAAFANSSTAPTLVYDGLGPFTMVKLNGLPLAPGDIAGAGHQVEWLDNGVNIVVLNPKGVQPDIANAFTGANTHAGLETFSGRAIHNGRTDFNAQVTMPEQVLTVTAGTASWDMSLGQDVKVVAAAALAFAAPTNLLNGMHGKLHISNTSGASVGLTWDAAFNVLPNTGALAARIPAGDSFFDYWTSGGVIYVSYAAAPGVPVLLNTLVANNSANLQDTTSFSGAYKYYKIICENLLPATNNDTPRFLPRVNGAFQGTCEYNAWHQSSVNGGSGNATSAISVDVVSNLVVKGGYNGVLTTFGANINTAYKVFRVDSAFVYTAATYGAVEIGVLTCAASTLPLTGFQFQFSAGNTVSGTIQVYGWN